MRLFEVSKGDYILGVGRGGSMGNAITEERYNAVIASISNKPAAGGTIDYRLRTDLTWEPYEIEPPDPDPELDEVEALEILLGEGGAE